jgi:hypothetical protein
MDRYNTGSAGAVVPSAGWNDIQDRALGIAQAAPGWLGPRPSASATGADNNVTVGPTPPLALGTTTVLPGTSGAVIDTGSLTGQGYLYANDTGAGALTFEASATAPDMTTTGLPTMTGNAAKVFVCSFYKASSSVVAAFRMSRAGLYLRPPLSLVSTSTPVTSLTAVSCAVAGGVPTYVRHALLQATLSTNSNSAQGQLYVAHADTGTAFLVAQVPPNQDSGTDTLAHTAAAPPFEVYLDSSNQFRYRNASVAAAEITQINLMGWREEF